MSDGSYDLDSFGLIEMTQLGRALRELGSGLASFDETAQALTQFLYQRFRDPHSDEPDFVLVRCYRTLEFRSLSSGLQEFATAQLEAKPSGSTTCLTLSGTTGHAPEWNDRAASQGHKTIALPSEEAVEAIPMVANLLVQLGIDVQYVVSSDPSLIMEHEQRAYNVFYVPDALGSPYIPAQRDFVVPYGVKSVLGFGGVLPSGSVFAVLLFARKRIPQETAEVFRNAALNAKLLFLPFDGGPTLSVPS